jgi:glycosyltransferase involved in cell wall biosynthesis
MIKIAYDYQTFTQQKYGGISRIFSEISPLINKSSDFEAKIYAGLYQNIYLSEILDIEVKGRYIPYPPKTLKLIERMNSIFCKTMLEFDRPDIVHETYYSDVKCAPKKSKTVITVLDMIHEKFLGQEENKDFLKIKEAAINRADHIICISENTRKDLLEIIKLPPEKVSTVYLGYSVQDVNVESRPLIDDPYILYVGQRVPEYKNFQRLLKAYGTSRRLQKEVKLVCFGPISFSQEEIDLIKGIGINACNVLYYSGGDLALANLYMHAEALIYPSLYEGFGLPPLEAMSLNCPVICSEISSIPEVVGNAGEYFDPYEIDSIALAIEKVVFSMNHKQILASKGRERAKLFTWDKCAKKTELVYKLMLNI